MTKIERIQAELEQAKRDVTLIQRLKTAEANAERLAVEMTAAQTELAESIALHVEAQREERFANFLDISTLEKTPNRVAQCGIAPTRSPSSSAPLIGPGEPRPIPISPSFPDAFQYPPAKFPERTRAKIMDFSPDDAWDAFNEYMLAKRRGYIIGRVATRSSFAFQRNRNGSELVSPMR